MNVRRLAATFAIFTVLGVMAVVFVDGFRQAPPVTPDDIGRLTIGVADEIAAGEDIVVTVEGATPGQQVVLTLEAGYGPISVLGRAQTDVTTFEIDAPEIAMSGLVVAQATTRDAIGTTTFRILPGEPTDPMALYLGPRTVVADGAHYSMIVAVPTDRFGNPVANGTSVDFAATRPDGSVDRFLDTTDGLLAFTRLPAGTVTGRTRVAAVSGEAEGVEQSFLEVPGIAAPFGLVMVDPIRPADGVSLMRLETSLLFDGFGNQMLDGVMVTLDTFGPAGRGRTRAPIIDGVAAFVIEAPDAPGEVRFVADAGGTISSDLVLDFPAAIDEIPAVLTFDVEDAKELPGSDGAIPAAVLEVGRVIDVDGAYVPDGTAVTVVVGGRRIEAVLEQGEARIGLRELPDTLDVTVLGITRRISLAEARR